MKKMKSMEDELKLLKKLALAMVICVVGLFICVVIMGTVAYNYKAKVIQQERFIEELIDIRSNCFNNHQQYFKIDSKPMDSTQLGE